MQKKFNSQLKNIWKRKTLKEYIKHNPNNSLNKNSNKQHYNNTYQRNKNKMI